MAKSFDNLRQKLVLGRKESVSERIVELPYLRKKAAFRPMMNKHLKNYLKAMESRDEFLINQSLDQVLESCVDTVDGEEFNADSICIQDRIFMLVKIREASMGSVAKFQHISEKLEEPVEVEVDIGDFPVSYQEEPLEEVINITDEVRVYLGPVTRKSEKEMETYLKKRGKKESIVDRRYCA
jgi:hypothetical protein